MRDDELDEPAFVSPPFSVLFLTTAKVIISAILVLGALALLGLIALLAAGVAWLHV